MSTPFNLQQLLDKRQLWPARRQSLTHGTAGNTSTGFTGLDQALHNRGWPQNGSTELLCDQAGIGELRLLMPRLLTLSTERPIAWLNPPYLPFPVFLEQQGLTSSQQCLIQASSAGNQLWAAEELLRSGAFSAVLSWLDKSRLQNRQLRRLHIAAREGDCWHLHFRPLSCNDQASPAPLRLALKPAAQALCIDILKQPGGHAGQRVAIDCPTSLLQQQTPSEKWPVYLRQHTVVQRQPLVLADKHRLAQPSSRPPSSHPDIH